LSNKGRGIRFQYSGYVIFAVQLFSVATGLIFTLLLTRNMSTKEYGVWTNIFDYIGYFTLFSGLLPFWATRFVARHKEGTVRTNTLAQLFIGLVSMAVYFPIIFLIYTYAIAPKIAAFTTADYLPIFLIAGTYILTYYMITCFEAILQPKKPEALGYGLLIEELVKVGVALVLILGLKQLFLGAVLALVLSCYVQVSYYVYLLRDDFKEKTNWSYLKEWIKGSTVIAYNAVGSQLLSFVLIMLFFFGGPTTRAYYQAAFSFTSVIGYSISLSIALYPKLLEKTCTEEQVGTSFRTVMMLAIPLTAIAMVMSVSFLSILNVAYGVAWPVLIALSIYTLLGLVSLFYSNCVLGVEAFDAGGKIHLRELFRSRIFKLFSLPYIQAAIELPLAYFVLTRLPIANSVQGAVYVIVIMIGVQVSTFGGLYWFMRRHVKIPVAWASLGKYALCAVMMGILMLLIPTTTTLLFTIGKAIVGFGIYVVLLLAIDNQARQLIRSIWKEIKDTIRQFTSRNDERDVFSGENGVKPTEN